MTSLKTYISPEARNIKFGQQVNFIQRVPLGTLPQEVVHSSPHNHVFLTNLFISRYRGLLLSNLGSKKQLLDKSQLGTASVGVVMPVPFDHVTLINLDISIVIEGPQGLCSCTQTLKLWT